MSDKTIIVIDGTVSLKLGQMTFAPSGMREVIWAAGDSVDVNMNGEWYNYTQDIFWSEYGEQEYRAAVEEYGSK